MDCLNETQSENTRWIASDKWCRLSLEDSQLYSPVVSHANFHKNFRHRDVIFSTFEESPQNSIVHVVEHSSGESLFGKITSIFTHQRNPGLGQPLVSETWASVQFFPRLSQDDFNPFAQIQEPEMQAHLLLYKRTKPRLIHISEVIAHCTWIILYAGEIHPQLNKKTIAVTSQDRE